MNDKQQEKKNTPASGKPLGLWIAIAVVVVLLIALAIGLGRSSGTKQTEEVTPQTAAVEEQASETESAEPEPETTTDTDQSGEEADSPAEPTEEAEASAAPEEVAESELPELTGSEGLSLSSVFTSSLFNTDGSGEYVEDLLSLEVTNVSENFLEYAELTAQRSDGTEAHFVVEGLPAGATADIFEISDLTETEGVVTLSLSCTEQRWLEATDVLKSDVLDLTYGEEGLSVTLVNTGAADLTDLTLSYHCELGGVFLGGRTQTMTVELLAPGEELTLWDQDLLGNLQVVQIN